MNHIKIENLSKEYLTGLINYKTLIFDVKNFFEKKRNPKVINALKDINISINKGEKIGLIGKNGSGKSTLLKILSDITRPTKGQVSLSGKVSSLIEVSAGFHEEMTGLENIFFKGVLLGYDHKQIQENLSNIIEFSGLNKEYLQTPVKKYSSGMTVKLAFAIHVSLPNEIMIFDEILAVGDEIFRQKSIDKMLELASKNFTIIFVSHNMDLIKQFCQRTILLDKGSVVKDGPTDEIIDFYKLNK